MQRRTTWAVATAAVLLTAACSSGGSAPQSQSSSSAPGGGTVADYVAMGDSYTAAPGVPEQDPSDPCLRSSRSYPQLVDAALRPARFADVSCSGAQTRDVDSGQTTGSGDLAPQIDAVTADTDLVTIGLGGNDFDLFTTLVGRCSFARAQDPTGSPCRESLATADGGDELQNRLPVIGQRLAAVVSEVQAKAPQAQVVLVGYPQIVPASGTCEQRLPLASGDFAYAREVNEGLNRVVSEVASLQGAGFADIWTASAGHDICSADPWINGREQSDRAAAFHPFAVEQRAVAGLVLRSLAAQPLS